MREFLWGMLTMASIVAGLFFLRYWRASRDRLFAFFASAFAVMSISWAGLAATSPSFEARHYVYLIRLLAFAIIIFGILDKNRRAGSL
jgi:hypothetical protein